MAGGPPSQPGLDRVDQALVALLQMDARTPNKTLAEQVGVAPSTCLERLRALRTRGVIQGFHAEIDNAVLGRRLHAIIAVRLFPHSRERVDEFHAAALTMPEVIDLYHVTGADDFLLHVGVPDMDKLSDFVLDRLASRTEIAHIESKVVYKHVRRPVLEPLGG